jgi:hypothetical protein
MNKQNIQDLIDLMSKLPAEQFDISRWTSKTHVSCNTPSCVAGWATTLPSWMKKGGLLHDPHMAPAGTGKFFILPTYDGETGGNAFAKWADIDDHDAWIICGLGSEAATAEFYQTEATYWTSYSDEADEWASPSPLDVVAALTRYLATGKLYS